MDSEVMAPGIDDDSLVVPETTGSRCSPSKKKRGKVPKRIHKSEREKLKREHFNDLFLDLANALEMTLQNAGKASILTEASRLFKNMLAEIENLKRENAALSSESQYVIIEKNELREDTALLEAQIDKLQIEIGMRMAQSKSELKLPPSEFHTSEITPEIADGHLRVPNLESSLSQPPVMGPLYVIPLTSAYCESGAIDGASNPTSKVRKPHARYPTSGDSWPSQLLGEQEKASS